MTPEATYIVFLEQMAQARPVGDPPDVWLRWLKTWKDRAQNESLRFVRSDFQKARAGEQVNPEAVARSLATRNQPYEDRYSLPLVHWEAEASEFVALKIRHGAPDEYTVKTIAERAVRQCLQEAARESLLLGNYSTATLRTLFAARSKRHAVRRKALNDLWRLDLWDSLPDLANVAEEVLTHIAEDGDQESFEALVPLLRRYRTDPRIEGAIRFGLDLRLSNSKRNRLQELLS